MSKRIYVGGLSMETSEDALRALCRQYGEVTSVEIVREKDTGRSKGFAFVQMSSEQEAARAIEGLNGREHEGAMLTAREGQDREERADRAARADRPHDRSGHGGGNASGNGNRAARRGAKAKTPQP